MNSQNYLKENSEKTMKRKPEVCDLRQVCLMKLFDNYEAVPDTKQYIYIYSVQPIWILFIWLMCQAGNCVPRPADSKTTLLMSLPQGECQVFLSKSLPEH